MTTFRASVTTRSSERFSDLLSPGLDHLTNTETFVEHFLENWPRDGRHLLALPDEGFRHPEPFSPCSLGHSCTWPMRRCFFRRESWIESELLAKAIVSSTRAPSPPCEGAFFIRQPPSSAPPQRVRFLLDPSAYTGRKTSLASGLCPGLTTAKSLHGLLHSARRAGDQKQTFSPFTSSRSGTSRRFEAKVSEVGMLP